MYSEVSVDGSVQMVVLRAGAVRHGLGNGDQLVQGQVGILGDLHQESIDQPPDPNHRAVRRRGGRGPTRSLVLRALGGPRPPVSARVRRDCLRDPRRRRLPQRQLFKDGRHGVHVVQRLARARRRYQEVAHAGVFQLQRHPPRELCLGRGRGAQDAGCLEKLEKEAAGDGVPLGGEQAHHLLDKKPAVPLGCADVGLLQHQVPALGNGRQPPARVGLERVADGSPLDGAGRLDGHHDAPEEVYAEVGDVARPPRRRGAGRRGGGVAAAGVRDDERRDGLDAPGRDAELLTLGGVAAGGGAEHGERVLPPAEEAGGEERVELGGEVAAVGGLSHAEARRRAAQGHDVVRADRDGHAVAELGAGLERLCAAREVRQLGGVGARAQSL
jgi:hypothetical protein